MFAKKNDLTSLKIGDFGLSAKNLSSDFLNFQIGVYGTFPYMAP